MIKILKETFKNVFSEYEPSYIGNTAYITLDSHRRVEIAFYNTDTSNLYDAVKFTLYHKEKGRLHCHIVKFKDVFECIQDMSHPNKIAKYIWVLSNEVRWYGKPTDEDIQRLNNVLKEYILLWS